MWVESAEDDYLVRRRERVSDVSDLNGSGWSWEGRGNIPGAGASGRTSFGFGRKDV